MLLLDIVTQRLMLLNEGELILSNTITESVTTDCTTFGHIGLRQLHSKLLCMQLMNAYGAETSNDHL